MRLNIIEERVLLGRSHLAEGFKSVFVITDKLNNVCGIFIPLQVKIENRKIEFYF